MHSFPHYVLHQILLLNLRADFYSILTYFSLLSKYKASDREFLSLLIFLNKMMGKNYELFHTISFFSYLNICA